MKEKGPSFRLNWFGERRAVRLMLLAALLTLGVINFHSVVGFCIFLWQIAQPLVMGAVMAYVLEVVVKRLERIYFPRARGGLIASSRRVMCILGAVVLVGAFLTLVVGMVIPGLMDAFAVLARELPRYFEQARQWVLAHEDSMPALAEAAQKIQFDWDSIQTRIVNYAMSGMGGILSSTVSVIGAVTGGLMDFFISLIFALFLLAGKERLHTQYLRLTNAFLRPRLQDRLDRVFSAAHKSFSAFIVGQSLNGLILGVATWLGMLVFGMPYALIVGVLSGATALIPIIGGYIGAILGAFLVFTVSPVQALWFLVFILILQQLQGNLVYPRLVGSSLGLPGMWVLVGVTIGGDLGGIGGMLAGVPILATAYNLLKDHLAEKEKGLEPGPEDPMK